MVPGFGVVEYYAKESIWNKFVTQAASLPYELGFVEPRNVHVHEYYQCYHFRGCRYIDTVIHH